MGNKGLGILLLSVALITTAAKAEDRCIIGNPAIRTYANQMVRAKFNKNDSFLREYWRYRSEKSLPDYLHHAPFVEKISKEKVLCSIENIPYVLGNRMICEDSNSSGKSIEQTPCVTNLMADYLYWGVNEALKCFSDYTDKFTHDIIYRKIHQESSFGFFFQYSGGDGIMQLVSYGKSAMYRDGENAHKFLVDHVKSHPNQCSSFRDLLAQTPQSKKYYNCEFISLGDGIGRNLLGGIGLYMYYRSGSNNSISAENILSHWGYEKTNSEIYEKVRDYIASGMYNEGSGAVYREINNAFRAKSLFYLTEKQKFDKILALINRSSFSGYIHSLENNPNKIFNQAGQCTLQPSTSALLAYQHSEQLHEQSPIK